MVAVMAGPIVLILALEHLIDNATIGTLLGALLGFILSPKAE